MLKIANKNLALSILSINSIEHLNQPWRYEIIATSSDKQLQVESILAQASTLTFQPSAPLFPSKKLSSLTVPDLPCTLYGVITKFSQVAVNKQEACYKVILEPRLALLRFYHYSAIYQN
ncbi:MAG: hypothetical protein J6562_02055 [Candidatus Schmidhempelia sp.]|nr:hypothetical protein [Candidatus Schmidhempelia sp.]